MKSVLELACLNSETRKRDKSSSVIFSSIWWSRLVLGFSCWHAWASNDRNGPGSSANVRGFKEGLKRDTEISLYNLNAEISVIYCFTDFFCTFFEQALRSGMASLL